MIYYYYLYSQNEKRAKRGSNISSGSLTELALDEQQKAIVVKHMSDKKKQQNQNARALENTFGWARVEVLTMVIVCTFLTSFCFSIVVEVIQTFFHVGHNDHLEHQEEFHTYTYEICIVLASLGLILNGISYLLIGGYTFHQGSFLHLTADGNVYVVDRGVNDKNPDEKTQPSTKKKSQVFHELARDACSEYLKFKPLYFLTYILKLGAVMVLVVSIFIVMLDGYNSLSTRLIDPICALISISILIGLSLPYSKLIKSLNSKVN